MRGHISEHTVLVATHTIWEDVIMYLGDPITSSQCFCLYSGYQHPDGQQWLGKDCCDSGDLMVFTHWWTSLWKPKWLGFLLYRKNCIPSNTEFSNLQSIWCLLGCPLKCEVSTAPALQLYPVLCIPRWYCENMQKCDFLYIASFYRRVSMHYYVLLVKYSKL